MRSGAKLKSIRYHEPLAADAYHGAEEGGVMVGKATYALGTEPGADVTNRLFRNLYQGCDASGNRVVGKSGKDHCAGNDWVDNADKTISVLAAIASDDIRRRIEQCVKSASIRTHEYTESLCTTRRGKGGRIHEPVAGTAASLFLHRTNRSNEPNLHVHCVLWNIGLRRDGSIGTLHSPTQFKHKMAIGAYFRSALAEELQRDLGLPLVQEGDRVKVVGVPEALVRALSTRTQAIERKIAEWKQSNPDLEATAKVRERAALVTRPNKTRVPYAELQARWRATAAEYGFTQDFADSLVHSADVTPSPTHAERAAKRVADALPPVVSEPDLIRRVGEETVAELPGYVPPIDDVRAQLTRIRPLSFIGSVDRIRHFGASFPESVAGLLQIIRGKNKPALKSVNELLDRAEKELGRDFTEGERLAAIYLTQVDRPRAVVAGLRSDARRVLARVVQQSFERRGLSLIAPAEHGSRQVVRRKGWARKNLIWDRSIKRLANSMEPTPMAESFSRALKRDRGLHPLRGLLHHAQAIHRPYVMLSRRSVVVLDAPEWGDPKDLNTIQKKADKAGATVLALVGSGSRAVSLLSNRELGPAIHVDQLETIARHTHNRFAEAQHQQAMGG